MKRLFIDIIARKERQLDLTGLWVARPQEAQEIAETLTIDLAVGDHSPWIGGEVQVRDEGGRCLFAYPIAQVH